MANSRVSEERGEFVVIDTAPEAGGYWTNAITPFNKRKEKDTGLYLNIAETGELSASLSATMTLQWRLKIDGTYTEWQVYDTYTAITNKVIDDFSANKQWRAGVDNGDFTSGQVTIGFNW